MRSAVILSIAAATTTFAATSSAWACDPAAEVSLSVIATDLPACADATAATENGGVGYLDVANNCAVSIAILGGTCTSCAPRTVIDPRATARLEIPTGSHVLEWELGARGGTIELEATEEVDASACDGFDDGTDPDPNAPGDGDSEPTDEGGCATAGAQNSVSLMLFGLAVLVSRDRRRARRRGDA